MRNYYIIFCLVLGFYSMKAIEPVKELSVAGKTFNLVSNLSEIETFDEIVLAAYPTKYKGVCCMTSGNYARYDKYRATACSTNGKEWDNENAIEILTVERNRDNLFAFKSDDGYLSSSGAIGIREKEITQSSLWKISFSNQNTLTCLKNDNPIYFYDVGDMFVFSNESHNKTAPYYIYKHVPQNKCGKPSFNLPQARYPKGVSVTVSCANTGETLSYSVYKNNSVEPFITGNSIKGSCVIALPEDELFADTKYIIHARAQAEGKTSSESIATYYICTKKYLAFTKINDISEISDNDIIIFVCPELGSAMANEGTITDPYNNRFGTSVEIKNNRVDIVSPENSDVAFFYANESANDANAFTFNDYSYRSIGKNGYLAENHNLWHVLATIENPDDPNYTPDWLVKIEGDKTLITPNTDTGFTKTLIGVISTNGSPIFQLHERKSMEQLQLKHVDIYHSDKQLSSASTIKAQSQNTKIKSVNGGVKVICEGERIISIYTIYGSLVNTKHCKKNEIIPLSSGFYIATTDRGESFKLIVR